MEMARRRFVFITTITPILAIVLTGCGEPSFTDVKGYISTARNFVDTVYPLLKDAPGADIAKLDALKKGVDKLDDTLQSINDPTTNANSTKGAALQFISFANQILAIALAAPTITFSGKAILVSVQLLLGAIGKFFDGGVVAMAADADPELVDGAKTRFDSASDKNALIRFANSEVLTWIAKAKATNAVK